MSNVVSPIVISNGSMSKYNDQIHIQFQFTIQVLSETYHNVQFNISFGKIYSA